MPSSAEMVGEFREVTDTVIRQQVNNCLYGPGLRSTWRDYDKVAHSYGLVFASLEPSDGRSNDVPFSDEHVWSVSPEKQRYLEGYKYKGHIAVVSFANEDERLFRNWSFESAMQMINPKTMVAIEDPHDISDILSWAKSPHLYSEHLDMVAALSDEEKATIDPQLEELSDVAADMHEDLRRMHERSHRPPPNDIVIR